MNHTEFAAAVKAKYPQYADMSDADLTRAMMAKFPEYSDVDTSGMGTPAQPVAAAMPTPEIGASQFAGNLFNQPAEVQSPGAGVQTSAMLLPRATANAQAGASAGPSQAWAGAKDALSLPGRTFAGMGGALGAYLGTPGWGANALQAGGEAFQQGMSDPGGNILERIVKDPLSLPLAATGSIPLKGALGLGARIAAGGSMLTGAQGADQAASPDAGIQMTPGINYAGAAGGEVLGAGLGRFLGQFTPSNVARWVMKRPTDIEGVQDFADAGLWPQVAAGGGTKRDVALRFQEQYPQAMQPLNDWQASADATAQVNPSLQYPQDRAIDAMNKAFQDASSYKSGSFSPTDQENAMNMVMDRMSGEGQSIMPSKVHQFKSTFGREGFDSNASKGLNEAKAVAFKGVASDMKGFLGSNFPTYQPAVDQAQPWQAAKSAMEYAASRGGTNNPIPLTDAIGISAGTPSGLAAALANHVTVDPRAYLLSGAANPARFGLPYGANLGARLLGTSLGQGQ